MPALPQLRSLRALARLSGLALALGLLAGVAAAVVIGWPPPLLAEDLVQTRLDIAVPLPGPERTIVQTFTPRHDGLASLELILVRYDPEDVGGRFGLTLEDKGGRVLAEAEWPNAAVTHNQVLRWPIPRQDRSAGQTFRLRLRGDAGNRVTAWGSSLDVMAGGELIGGEPAHELRLVTRYRLLPRAAMETLVQQLADAGLTLLLGLALLPLPGALALALWRPGRSWDAATQLGVALALGLAIWPLLWLGLTLVGGRWTGGALWATLALGWPAALIVGRRAARAAARPPAPFPPTLVLLLLLGLAVRLLAVRDLAFPAWVDASRHGLIVELMRGTGRFPADYRPLLPVDRAPYHFGFHAVAAGVDLLRGGEVPALLLALGQLLNALTPLTTYAGVWLVVRRRGPALLAAFLVALPFFFPAYYATWGRYTQLTGMVLWPVLLALTWQLLRGARHWARAWPLVGMLAAGLFLIHVRLFLLYLPYAGLAWLVSRFRRGRALAAAAALGGALIAPRALQLAQTLRGARLASPIPGYNAFPIGYVEAGWERWFYLVGGLVLLGAAVAAWRGRRWAWWTLVLAGWLGGSLVLLSGRVPGVPDSWVINVNSVLITVYAPLAMVLGVAAARAARWLGRRHAAIRLAAALALGAGVAAAALFGVRQQITILNETTILARPADAIALAWLAEHLPPDAMVAVNAWRWQGPAWAASDGGAWITPVTGHATTTPPVDYVYGRDLAATVVAFNEGAQAVTDWAHPDAAAWLRAQGVTHVYVGPRGGFFDPVALAANPGLARLYAADGAFVFAVAGEPDP